MKNLVLLSMFVINIAWGQVETSSLLLPEEKALIARIANLTGATVLTGSCARTEFTLSSTVQGFNPALWSVRIGPQIRLLGDQEKNELVQFFNRLEVEPRQQGSNVMSSTVSITAEVCEMVPARWTATFIKRDESIVDSAHNNDERNSSKELPTVNGSVESRSSGATEQ